jgi:hypothetical protein
MPKMSTADGLRFADEQTGAPILPESRQGDPKQSILKMEGGSFNGTVRMASCWRRARISAISSIRGARNERANVRRKRKRAKNEKWDHEIWIRKVG